jgi:DNA-directed RNA polymerase subunit RPC12/RpoP
MKFLCIDCDEQMRFDERQQPGDGTFAAAFACPRCGRRIAMLANPMETQLVESLGVKIGGRTLEPEPMELVRGTLVTRDGAFLDSSAPRPRFTLASQERLERVPSFVRGMVKRLYTEYAVERGISEITPDVMDRARSELGLEGM